MSKFGSIHSHTVNHIHHGDVLDGDNTLYVIGVVSNPARWHSRYRITREWITHMVEQPNIKLTMVEAAFGARHHEICVPEATQFDQILVRVNSETWIKESMINLAFRNITAKYPNAKYFAWVDCDIFFRDHNWAQETIQQLQHFEIVQPWRDCSDLDARGNILQHFKSFGYQDQRGVPKQTHSGQYYEYAHSGFAWACTRSFVERMWGAGGSNGPLMDWAVLGSADHHMAFACINQVNLTIKGGMSKAFFRKCFEWQQRAFIAARGEVGFTNGRIEHLWHGNKKNRYYRERWEILTGSDFDPDTQLIHDEQGISLVGGNLKLEKEIRKYNRSRFEDSLE